MRVRFVVVPLPGVQGRPALKDLTVSYEYTMNEELKEDYVEPEKDQHPKVLTMLKTQDNKFEAVREMPLGKISQIEFKDHERVLRDDTEIEKRVFIDAGQGGSVEG